MHYPLRIRVARNKSVSRGGDFLNSTNMEATCQAITIVYILFLLHLLRLLFIPSVLLFLSVIYNNMKPVEISLVNGGG